MRASYATVHMVIFVKGDSFHPHHTFLSREEREIIFLCVALLYISTMPLVLLFCILFHSAFVYVFYYRRCFRISKENTEHILCHSAASMRLSSMLSSIAVVLPFCTIQMRRIIAQIHSTQSRDMRNACHVREAKCMHGKCVQTPFKMPCGGVAFVRLVILSLYIFLVPYVVVVLQRILCTCA